MPAGIREVWRLGSFGFLFVVYLWVLELMGCRGAGKGCFKFKKQLKGGISGRGEVHVYRRWVRAGVRRTKLAVLYQGSIQKGA
jgi:hypothetical protein